MKKLLFSIITILLLSLSRQNAIAASSSPTPTPAVSNTPIENQQIIQQIDELKNKVASKVAELKLVEKRGIIGTVVNSSDTKITLNDVYGNTRFVDVDELTNFSSDQKASFGISDVTKGMKLGVLGLYNKESRRLLARFIDVMTIPEVFNGTVVDKDTSNFTLSVATTDNKIITVDIENVTKAYEFSNTGDLVKNGFSKMQNDQNVIVIGFPNDKIKDRITGSRIIVFPGVPKNPKIIVTPSPQATTSAKNLTPTP